MSRYINNITDCEVIRKLSSPRIFLNWDITYNGVKYNTIDEFKNTFDATTFILFCFETKTLEEALSKVNHSNYGIKTKEDDSSIKDFLLYTAVPYDDVMKLQYVQHPVLKGSKYYDAGPLGFNNVYIDNDTFRGLNCSGKFFPLNNMLTSQTYTNNLAPLLLYGGGPNGIYSLMYTLSSYSINSFGRKRKITSLNKFVHLYTTKFGNSKEKALKKYKKALMYFS